MYFSIVSALRRVFLSPLIYYPSFQCYLSFVLQNFSLDIDLKVKRFLSSTTNSTAYSLSPDKKNLLCSAVECFSGKFEKNKSLSKCYSLPQPGDVLLSFDPVKVTHSVTTSGAIIAHCLHFSVCSALVYQFHQ